MEQEENNSEIDNNSEEESPTINIDEQELTIDEDFEEVQAVKIANEEEKKPVETKPATGPNAVKPLKKGSGLVKPPYSYIALITMAILHVCVIFCLEMKFLLLEII